MQILKELWTGDCEDEIRNTYQYVLELRNRLEKAYMKHKDVKSIVMTRKRGIDSSKLDRKY